LPSLAVLVAAPNKKNPQDEVLMTTEKLFEAALALPDEARLELVEALAAPLQPEDRTPFDESWGEIIRRRSAELRSGVAAPVAWSEVKRQAWEKLGG
jgi:hypothetical protein